MFVYHGIVLVRMAGTVTRDEAEAYWKKYNKDGNDELTVDEVKQCLSAVYEDQVDDFDVNVSFRIVT